MVILVVFNSFIVVKNFKKPDLVARQNDMTSAFFHRKSANFGISRNTDIDCFLIKNF